MLLSEYDRIVGLFVDRRFNNEMGRVWQMLAEHGVKEDNFKYFLEGQGDMFPPIYYDQISPTPPSGWVHGKGAYAHFRAMKTVIAQALADNVQNLLWIEDDCVLTDNFDEVVADANRQLLEQGEDGGWDLLYYGANHTWATTYEVTPNVLRCCGSLTTHCVGIKRHMFLLLLNLPENHVIDKVIANCLHHNHRCYAIWPAAAVQKPGYSFISNMQADYTHYFKSRGANQQNSARRDQ